MAFCHEIYFYRMKQDPVTQKLHERVDSFFNRLRLNQPMEFSPPCREGCFWCCYEPLLVNDREVDYLLGGLTKEQIQGLKTRIAYWLTKAKPFLKTAGIKAHIALEYRRANIPCPLLVDGRCSVYERRPYACRSYFAKSEPQNCAMPMREHQEFIALEHPTPIDQYLAEYFTSCDKAHFDHLGVHLANKVLGMNMRSAATQHWWWPYKNYKTTYGNEIH